jgi:hypothetical protein
MAPVDEKIQGNDLVQFREAVQFIAVIDTRILNNMCSMFNFWGGMEKLTLVAVMFIFQKSKLITLKLSCRAYSLAAKTAEFLAVNLIALLGFFLFFEQLY